VREPIQEANEKQDNWKQQTYIIGTIIGAAMGFLSAYLFTREAENEGEGEDGKRPEIPPHTLLGLAISALRLVNQITDSARKKKK